MLVLCVGDRARRRGRLLAGHTELRAGRSDAQPGHRQRRQTRHPCGELLCHRVGGIPQRLLRGGGRRVRRRDGRRCRKAQGLRVLRPAPAGPARRRHGSRDLDDRARGVLTARSGLLRAVRGAPRRDACGDDPCRVEEPRQRDTKPQGAIPFSGVTGDDRRRRQGRRPAGRLRLFRSVRRGRLCTDRAGRSRARLHRHPDVRGGALPGRRIDQGRDGPGL